MITTVERLKYQEQVSLYHTENSPSVVKRDGTKATINIQKIRNVVSWACKGLDVSDIKLEAGLTTRLKEGITTREIQNNLINVALNDCSIDEPDWRYVAGRLMVWSLWKDTKVTRGYGYGQTHYRRLVNEFVDKGKYDNKLLTYTDDELDEAGSWIVPERDKVYDYAGIQSLTKRYLLPQELIQEAYLSIALLLALPEILPRERMKYAKRFYDMISERKISLATPLLANLRVPEGNLASCFIIQAEDDLRSIFRQITNTALISKNGGGVGCDLSKVRSTGSWIRGHENASGGVIPWIKILNDTILACNQLGRRTGSATIAINTWHLDIEEFLELQTESGDQRKKAYDIFPQLVISDEFMRRVETEEKWTLLDPYEVKKKLGIDLTELWGDEFTKAYRLIEQQALGTSIKLFKQVSARVLFKQIMRIQVESGLPYLFFKDTVNAANPNKHLGIIPSANLCVESYSTVKADKWAHSCNLLSLNLANIESTSDLANACEVGVRILDNAIDLTSPPIPEAKAHNEMFRTIGVGAMGLADWLAKRKLNYSSLTDISNLFEDFGYFCTRASMNLGKERGTYKAFIDSEWDKGKLINSKSLEDIQGISYSPDRWIQLHKDIALYGIRNSHITAIAPNTSSALVQGCTPSVLPTYSRFFYNSDSKGSIPIAPPFIREYYWYYQENKNLDQKVVVNAISTIQQWIDTGISMELIINPNLGITAKDIYDLLMLAWTQGCKAVYYIRSVQKHDISGGGEYCSSCSG